MGGKEKKEKTTNLFIACEGADSNYTPKHKG
jgi:hypothetical protein